jgi:hypothetical protein
MAPRLQITITAKETSSRSSVSKQNVKKLEQFFSAQIMPAIAIHAIGQCCNMCYVGTYTLGHMAPRLQTAAATAGTDNEHC